MGRRCSVQPGGRGSAYCLPAAARQSRASLPAAQAAGAGAGAGAGLAAHWLVCEREGAVHQWRGRTVRAGMMAWSVAWETAVLLGSSTSTV